LADDHERWKKITQGDAAAYDAFYRETAPRLRLFLRQLVGSIEAAEDVAQETYTRIWSRPPWLSARTRLAASLPLRSGQKARG
jgi:RNA polymerase sigma-70 factor (ECF subfamily)